MQYRNGIFTVSLDFELYWGIRDKKDLSEYGKNLLGVKSAIPAILELFDEYNIHATWACVGLILFDDFDDMIRNLPSKKVNYIDKKFSPYEYIINGLDGKLEVREYHYAPSLIKLIQSHRNQEIATHTFSHYYCLEKGSNIDTFKADIDVACQILERYNVDIKSFVFPRNQTQADYLSVLEEKGILSYRGNEISRIYTAINNEADSLLRRAIRLIDAYIKLTGSNCYSLNEIADNAPFNIRSSRFLRPYSHKLRSLEPLRSHRIISDLSHAAKKDLIYHLWWHPHNFGTNLKQNISFLRRILKHYQCLQQSYGMESLNMAEISEKLIKMKSAYNISMDKNKIAIEGV